MSDVYYKTSDYNVDDVKTNNEYFVPKHILTAKKAREMTNKDIIEKLANTLKGAEEAAKEGKKEYIIKCNKKYDYEYAINYLHDALGYQTSIKNENEEFIWIEINW